MPHTLIRKGEEIESQPRSLTPFLPDLSPTFLPISPPYANRKERHRGEAGKGAFVVLLRLEERETKAHLVDLASSRECYLPRTAQRLLLHVLTISLSLSLYSCTSYLFLLGVCVCRATVSYKRLCFLTIFFFVFFIFYPRTPPPLPNPSFFIFL